MPTVPTYDNFQTQLGGGSSERVQQASGPGAGELAGDALSRSGDAMTNLGGVAAKLALEARQQADQLRVDDATIQLTKARTAMQVEAMGLTGRAALERPDNKSLMDEYGEKMQKAAEEVGATLGNPQQKQTFKHHANLMASQLMGTLGTHVVQQQKQFQEDTWRDGAEQYAKQGGLLWGDAAMVAESRAGIEGIIAKMAKANGWDATKDKATIESARDQLLAPLHAGVVQGMLGAGKPEMADAYYKANSTDMSLQTRVRLHDAIQSVDVVVRGDRGASEVWSAMAPRGLNDPVKLFDMEQAIHEKFKGEPKVRDAAMSALKQRSAAFNAQQAEVNAGSINTVYGMVDSGVPLNKIKTTPAWLALPETKRHDIVKNLESEAATRAARGASEAARGASMASRELSMLTVADKMSMFRNGDAYLRDTDPDRLAGMTRAQVEAKRTVYGMEGTQHLLAKWEQVQNKDGKLNAKIDNDAFKAVVKDVLNIDAYDSRASAETKAKLGTLKNKVDILLQNQAQTLRRPLTTEEKTQIFRDEAAKTVTVGGWWNSEELAAKLSPSDARKVVIPEDRRAKLVADMQRAYTLTGDKDYAPTPENLARIYLKGVSPLAGMPNAK
jgi:hypothetical protein